MAKVTAGLKELSKRELLPDGEYRLRIGAVKPTRDGTGEGAICTVLKGPDPEVKGKHPYFYMRNIETEQSIGLSMLMKHFQILEVPDGPYGEQDTRNFEGQEFDCTITTKPDKTGEDRNNINPTFDSDWWAKVQSGEITADEPKKKKPKGRR